MAKWKHVLTPSLLQELFDWGWFDDSGLMSKEPRDGAVFDLVRTYDERWASQLRGCRVSETSKALKYAYPQASFPTSIYSGSINRHKLIPAVLLGAHAEQSVQLDHIDRNKLNYDPRNLRMCTPAQNAANKRVNPQPNRRGWQIKVQREKTTVFLRSASVRKHGSDEAAQAWLIAEYEEWLANNSPTLPTIWNQYLERTSGMPYQPQPLQRYVRQKFNRLSSHFYDGGTMTMKTCISCKETKPLSEFGIDRARKDQANRVCKLCIRTYYRNRRAERKAGAPYRPRVRRKTVKQDEPVC